MATREQVYEKFGWTAEAAQLFETDLGTMLLALEGEQQRWHISADRERATEFYEKLNRKTLGQLLVSLRKYIDLDDNVAGSFERALTARNRLNHGFFEHHNFAINSEDGRDTMLSDLEEMHTQLFDAWQIAQRAAASLVERLQAAKSA